MSININNRQKLIWSNIRNRLNISLHEKNLIDLIKIPDVQERLEKFLSYYIEGNKNEDLPNNLKFLNRQNIDPLMKDFIISISDCLNMTRKNCFDLMDNYFYVYPEELDKLSKLLKLYIVYHDKSSRRYENIVTDIEDKKAKIIEFYFKERKNLILFYSDIFFKIFLEVENTPMDLLRLMEAFIKSKNLLQVFSKQLVSYDDIGNNKIFDRNKFNNHFVKEIIYKIPVYMCEEQNLILELIMILLDKGKFSDENAFEILFNYFLKTNFFCYSQNLNADNNKLKEEIMIKSLIIILDTFQPEIINKVIEGETNLLNSLICLKNYFNTLLKVYEQPLNNYILFPIKLTIASIIELIKKNQNSINNSNNFINKFANIPNKDISDRDYFGILNLNDQKVQLFEGEYNIEKGLTIYDVYYDILYEWINMIMSLYYDENIETYDIQMVDLLFRVLSHYLPQRKFYSYLLNKKYNKIIDFFELLKVDDEKRGVFLSLCFSLSKSIEPGEGNDNNEYLLYILFTESIEDLKNKIKDFENNFQKRQEIIEGKESDIFFCNILDEWNNLIQELYKYSQQYQNLNQIVLDNQEALPKELSNQINYIRLFIRSVLPKNCFSNFIFNYTWYYNLKEKNNNDINIDNDEDDDLSIQVYNPEILKQLVFNSVTVLNMITELQVQNRNNLFGEFITELLKLFIIYTKDSHFTESLKNMNFFFEKFSEKNITYNIIVNDYNSQDFTNTLYAVKFLNQMFKPDIFLVVSRNSDYNTPNKNGEIFYVSNFYFIKELVNHFTQVNEYLSPLNALLIAELGEVVTQVMNYLEFKNNNHKVDIIETQNIYYENKNLANFVIQMLIQDNKDYAFEDDGNQNNINSLLLLEFIFKYIGIKINDKDYHNLNLNENKQKINYNNTYVQLYLRQNNIAKENFNANNSYNMSCYKKMILSVMNCLNKILSLIIILQRNESKKDKKTENIQKKAYKLNNIDFINKLYNSFVQNKDIPHYIYESIDDKKKYNFNIILLLFFYSLYEIDKNEQLITKRKLRIDLDEENPSDLEFFMVDLKDYVHLNISTSALNSLCKIIYIIRDTGININNYFNLEEISSSELYTNIKLFKYIRYKIVNILGNQNISVDSLKIEILKFLIISTKYQHIFIRDFIQGDDDIHHNSSLFNNLNQSLKLHYNFSEIEINNDQVDYDIKINTKSLKSELYTYIIMFISELLNETQDIKTIESLLIKDNGILFMKNLIRSGIHSCDIGKNYDKFYEILTKYLNNSKNNISDIMFISNSFKLEIEVLSLKLNIIRAIAVIFKRILLFSKITKNIKIDFKFSFELNYFIKTHISDIVEFYSKSNQYDYIEVLKDMKKDLEINGLQLRLKYLNADNNMNKENLEMIVENYLYRYDYNFSFDLKEFIVKGFYDKMFREKYLKKIVINNSFTCFNYLIVQSLVQCAHLYGLIFSIGDYNYLLTNKLFSDCEIYKIFNESNGKNELINIYTEEIDSILNYDNCYNYKLTFNPLDDFFKKEGNEVIKFIKKTIIDKCINTQNIPKLTLDEHRVYYQMLNISFGYIIYLYNKSAASKSQINVAIDLFDFLKKVSIILNEGVLNKAISDTNLLSVLNLIHHIICYMVLTEKSFDSSNQNNDNSKDMNNIISNEINNDEDSEDNDDKIQIIIDLMSVLITLFKNVKESRSLLLYIFSTIAYIKNDELEKQIMELFNIIIKLYTKENDSFEFHSFLLLLYRLKINYPMLLMEILKDSQIFNFISIKCGYNLEYKLYDNQIHTTGHLIYCWTLKIFNAILDTYLTKISTELKPNYNIVISYCMKFIELIQQRLKTLFNICINENSFSGGNQNNYISMAYLDELKISIEFINSFISIECDNSCPNTKDPSFLEFLFDSIDLIVNTCLFLFKNNYQQIVSLCKPNSKLETFMMNTKIIGNEFNDNNNINNINNFHNTINLSNFKYNGNDNNIYKFLIDNNNPGNNNEPSYEDKAANVFYFKIKINLIMILFHISSGMIHLVNRQNFNLKQYFFNKYQLKENENQLYSWPMLYLNSIKFASDFLRDIIMNLKKYKLLYNKSTILTNSLNISFSNCFINEVDPEYPLNELIDLILFILSDFCTLNINFNEFIGLIVKSHPYMNNNRVIIGDIYQLTKRIENGINKYSREFEEEDNFIEDFKDLKNIIGDFYNKNNKYKN